MAGGGAEFGGDCESVADLLIKNCKSKISFKSNLSIDNKV